MRWALFDVDLQVWNYDNPYHIRDKNKPLK